MQAAGRRGWQLGGVAIGAFVLWTVFQKLLLLVVAVFVALLFAALLMPVTDWLEGRGVPRTWAAVLTVVGGILLAAGVTTLLVMQFLDQLPTLRREYQQVRQQVMTWLTQGPLQLTQQQIDRGIQRAMSELRGSWSAIASQAFGVLKAVGGLLTALVLTFFLVRDAGQLREWTLARLVADEERPLVAASVRRGMETLQGYIQATVIIGALDALLIGAALVVLGVPLAVPLAVLTFFGGFFPVAGATVAGGVAALVALVSGGLVHGLIVLGVVVVVQQVDGNILQPVIMGRAVRLHPVVVLVVLTAGALVAGIVGALMAVPMTAVLAAIGNEVRERRGQEAVQADEADDLGRPL